ncbi:MAG TPA: DMT family transporter [Methylomirabilota bacterium]|nr:DMT family transporter [Methylomirabilota bacterium]
MSGSARLGALPVALLLLCCLVWGLNQVAIKVGVAGISPLMGAGLRSLVAAALVWLWCGLRGEPMFRRDGTGPFGLLIGLLFAGEVALIYWGLAYTTASRSVIFLYSAPFFVALGAHRYIAGERLTRARTAGLVVAFAGLCLACADALHLPSRRELFGDMLELAAGFLWGATTVVIKKGGRAPLTPSRMLFYQLAISSGALIGASLALREPGVVAPTVPVLAALAYQAVIVAFASYLAWFWLLRRYPASDLAPYLFWTPLAGVLAGWVLLGDPLSANLAAAAALVALGIYLVNR